MKKNGMIRRIGCLGIVLGIWLCTAAGVRADQDLPGPVPTFELIPAGSYVIPMDTNHQNIGSIFNMKAYGLVNRLLQTNIPVKWAIAAGKTKNTNGVFSAADLTGKVVRIFPSALAESNRAFFSGPFIVHKDFTNAARSIISSYSNNVAVFELTTSVVVDVRYTLTHKPRIAVFNDGGTAAIHADILVEGGFRTNDYQIMQSTNIVLLGATSCFTFASSPHYDGGAAATNQANAVKNFVLSGGNFFGQCAAVRTYENIGKFQSTLGFADDNRAASMQFFNADLPINQFEGRLADEGGSLRDWRLATGSLFTSNSHTYVQNNPLATNSYVSTGGKLHHNAPGSMVFYLGGHEYVGTTIDAINGRRMYLNAIFVPPDRPAACGITFTLDLQIRKSDFPDPVIAGSNLTYTIVATNAGPFGEPMAVVTDTLPAQVTYVSHVVSTGTYNGVTGEWIIGDMPKGASHTLTLTVTVHTNALGLITNKVTIGGVRGDTNPTNNIAFEPTLVLCENVPPTITCPPNVTIQCTASTHPTNTGTAVASDNATVSPAVTFSDSVVTGSCPQNLIITRTWQAVDNCANTSTCQQIITVVDTVPPVVTCPAPVTVQCIGDVPVPNTNLVVASDNCTVNPAKTHVGDSAMTNGCVITITRTYRATDECGNSTDCDQIITVQDTIAPQITCPADITVECIGDVPAPNTNLVSASDNCVTPAKTHVGDTAVTNGCVITITRTYRATDECGNSTTCTQTITVNDTIPPQITCPAPVTVQCIGDVPAPNTNLVVASDNCTVNPAKTHVGDTAQTNGCVITITRTYRATDECGNSTTCTQTITVNDTIPPQITCPADVTVECLADVPAVNTNAVSASDNCTVNPAKTHVGDSAMTNGCVITITRTYRATDECGNSTDCDQIITVQDTIAPQITCPADITVECIGDVPAADTDAVSASDNCTVSPVKTHVGDSAMTNGCVITITRTYRATDECGNSTDCDQIITVQDTIAPQITCPADITVECIGDVPAPNTNLVSASDNCVTPAKTHVGDTAVTNGCVITITRTYRATDECGNSTTCTQTITVNDTIPPQITCPAPVTVQCIGDVPAPNTNLVVASDNCTVNPAKTHVGDTAQTNGCVITITRTYRATDECGNSTDCDQIITVQDTIAPQITCPAPVTVQCIADVPAPNTNAVSASDNCTVSPVKTHVGDSAQTNGCIITITRTYRATDECGNSTDCDQIITVQDTIAPQITCPAPVTVQCIADVPAPNTNAVSASDNCTVSPVKTHVGDSAQTNGCIITITRTYRATDECGNSTDCDQIITVQDTIAPQITCPADVTVECLADVPAVNTNAVSASDNCTVNPAKTHVGDSAMTNGCVITITRTYRATDECGNSTDCDQIITVQDTIAPQITCPAPVTVQCIADVPAPNTGQVSASDNCTANPVKTHVGDSAQTNGCVIMITRTYRATDECGNSTTCTQTITVNDTIPPQITCPAPVTVQCIGDVPAPNTGQVLASDNCTANPIKTHVGDSAQTNGCVITITRTYRATDACGNSTTCTQTITVSDTIPPQITCPAPVTVQCIGDVPAPNTNLVVASDNCTVNPAKTHVGDSAQTNGCVITITRTYRATDACGNSTTCTQTITVQDTIPPQITCPAPVTVQCIGDVPVPNTGQVSASDNCTANPAKTHVGDSAVTNGCVITITRTYRATDACGNSTTCTQTITVQDTIPPQITCPAPVTVQCIGDVPAPNTNLVVASDNCTVNPAKTHVGDTAQTNGCVITITRTYRATDECGNSTTCTQTITVQDTIPPQITCPAPVTVQCIGDVPAPNTNAVSASDNCTANPAKTHVGDTAVTNGCVITITRTYRATDECGNSTTCTQTITVQDTIPPQITCPVPVTVQCIGDVPVPNTNLVVASDNCTVNPAKTHVGDSAVTNGCVITITRTYRATDACGNSTTCTQTITVQDTIPPQITCPAPVTVQCIGDVPAPNTNLVVASDNCTVNPAKTHVGDSAVTNSCVITITRTYRATDACGNSTTCTQTITVQDTIAPQITCPADITVECIGDVPAPNTGQVSASDNCTANPVKTHVGDSAQTNGCVITITRTYRATDACGNSTTCTQTITVNDTIPPQITCPAPVTVQCIGDVPAPNTNLVVASDNCTVNPAKTHVGDTAQTNGCVITITRTYRATDECGNSTTCTQTITVQDTIPPQITCPAPVTVQCIGDVPAPNTNLVSASDNCVTPAKTHVGDSAQTNGCVITITRTYRATDACGNSTTCTQTITVQDTIPPQITCPAPVTVQCIGDVPAPNTNLVVASDNCTVNPAKTHVGDSAQTNGCVITITRTYRATDACGNSTTCTQTITVQDTIPPQITCPAPVTVQCIGDVPAPNTNLVVASDNCTVNPAKTHVGDSAQTNGCVITITRTYRATDACGNSTTCTQTITVQDTIPPQITCPAPVTVQCIGDVPAPNTNLVVASDNCTVNPAKTHVGDSAQTNGCVITITRTYRATDECGNSTDCDQIITVQDTIAPQITCPADITVECIGDVPAADTDAVSASDNCTVSPVKTHVGDSAQTNGCIITITRTYRATDECGNSTDCDQIITVQDTIAPQITCPAPVTVQCIGDVPAPNTGQVSASDNCTANPVKTHVGDSAVTNGCVITITRTYRATDACGNSTTCTQTITVNDTIPPQITCPAPVTVQCIGDVPVPNTNLVSASDNCVTPAKTHVGDSAVTNGCVITITRTYRATDACGNSTTCTQTITVQDTIPPQITCPAPVTVQCIGNVPAPNTNLVSASDNCVTPAKTHVGDSAQTNGCVITITRTYRATDACGNSTTCTQTITVNDTIPPQITCPAPVTVQCIGDVPAPNTGQVSASDNCTANPVKTHVGDSAVTNGCVITITRTYRATDACGNSTTCTQTITVNDTIPPQITCPAPVTVQCIGNVPAPNTNLVSASDNCVTPAKTHVGDSAQTNGCVITITRTYRATDACGNSTTCTQTITVQDTIPPQITCPAPVTVQCIGNVPPVNTNAVQVSDNCGVVGVTHVGDSTPTSLCGGTITRTYRATDSCGNSVTCTQIITINDTIPPQIISCPPSVVEVQGNANCQAQVPSLTGQVFATDNCDTNLTITQVPPAGTTFTITTNVTIIVTDDCGNTNASCQITVRTPCNPSFAIEKTLTNVYFEVGSTNLRPPMVGEPLNFVITITNTGPVNLPVVALEDRYNTNHLLYVNAAPPSVNNVNDGVINWTNVGPLAPGASTSVVVNFIAVGAAMNPNGTNYAIVTATPPTNTPPLPPQTNDEPYVIIPPGAIGDQVWVDDDAFTPPGTGGNGIPDQNMVLAGTNGVSVRLTYVVGNVTNVITKQTGFGPGGIRGYYLFTNLPPGQYVVDLMTNTISNPSNNNPFIARFYTTVRTYTVTLGYGQQSLTNDFGYFFAAPTAVDLARFSATRTESGVQVSWTTAVELENLGFNVYRAASLGGERVKLNGALIEGQGTASGQDYGLLDSTAEAGVRYYYWLEDVDWSLKGTLHGPVVVYGDEQGVDRTLAGFEAQREGLYRVSYETLAKAGVNVGAENPAMLQVYVNGSEVAAFVTAYGAPMKQGDFILFYASAPEGEAVEVEIRSGAEEGKRMEELYVAPAEGEGDVWYGVAGQDNRLVFEASEAYVRYLLMGFESGPVWLLDVTDTAATKLLFGYSTLSVNGDVGIYMSYFTEQPARCVALDPSTVIEVKSVQGR